MLKHGHRVTLNLVGLQTVCPFHSPVAQIGRCPANNQELGNRVHSFAAKTRIGCFAMLVLNPSFFIGLSLQPKLKVKFKISMFTLCLCHFYVTDCALLELPFDH